MGAGSSMPLKSSCNPSSASDRTCADMGGAGAAAGAGSGSTAVEREMAAASALASESDRDREESGAPAGAAAAGVKGPEAAGCAAAQAAENTHASNPLDGGGGACGARISEACPLTVSGRASRQCGNADGRKRTDGGGSGR